MMICQDCREGGALNKLANIEPGSDAAERLRLLAWDAHLDCPGKCECQHYVGMALASESDSR